MAHEKNKCNACTHYTGVCSEIGHDNDRLIPDGEDMEKVYEKINDKLFGKPYMADMFTFRFYNGEFAKESAVFISPYGHFTDIANFFDLIDLSGALNEIQDFVVAIKLKCTIKPKHGANTLTTRLKLKHAACFKLEGDFMAKIIECFSEQLKDYEYCVSSLKISPDCMWYY